MKQKLSTLVVITVTYLAASSSFVRAQSLKDAIRMSDNEQFESATKQFEQLIAKDPSNGELFYYYGENLYSAGEREKAKIQYAKGIEVAPANALNYVGLGKVNYDQGKIEDANAAFFKAKTISKSKNATVLMEIAEVYIDAELKNTKEALALLNQAATLDPQNPRINILLGDACLEQSDGGSQAIKYYEKALEIDKHYTKALLREGKLWSHAKNYPLALENYNKAITIDSTFAPAYRERAELLFRAGQSARAANDYLKYLSLNDNLSARVRYASFKFVSKDYKTAVDEISSIQKKDSSDANLYRLKGYSYVELKQYPEGLYNMEAFFKKNANGNIKIVSNDYEYLGKAQLKLKKDSVGRLNLQKAIAMDSSKIDLWGDIGGSYLKTDKFDLAVEAYNKKINATKGKVGNANDYYGLGRAYYFAKDYIKADTTFALLIQAQPTLTLGYLWRARANSNNPADVNEKKEIKGMALPYYDKYTQLVAAADVEKNKRDLIEAYEYVGYYCMLTKNVAKAKETWGKLKEIDPENLKAKKALADPSLK